MKERLLPIKMQLIEHGVMPLVNNNLFAIK